MIPCRRCHEAGACRLCIWAWQASLTWQQRAPPMSSHVLSSGAQPSVNRRHLDVAVAHKLRKLLALLVDVDAQHAVEQVHEALLLHALRSVSSLGSNL